MKPALRHSGPDPRVGNLSGAPKTVLHKLPGGESSKELGKPWCLEVPPRPSHPQQVEALPPRECTPS